MYKNVIKKALEYTRPFLIGRLFYGDKFVSNDISTMIVLNKNGDILTTAHNAEILVSTSDYNDTFPPILKEISEAKPKNIPKIEKKYGIEKNTIVGMQNILIDIADNPGKLKITNHPYLDLAIISIENKENLLVNNFPVFAKNNLEPGNEICTLGFAFPEYKAFKYDEESFKIKSNYEFMNFPIFPTNGIICRNIADKENKISMFEMTNIIATGQEGGPVLDKKGHLNGMILGFKVVSDYGWPIKIGIGINIKTIKDFLNSNNIEYEVEEWKRK